MIQMNAYAHGSGRTSLGLQENVEAALSYVLGWVTGIIFYLVETRSTYVRYHAFQSLVTFLSIQIVTYLLRFIPIFGWMLAWLLGILAFILWIVCILKAYQGSWFKIPIAGDLALQYSRYRPAPPPPPPPQ